MKRITILTIAAFFLAELASQAERYYYFEHLKTTDGLPSNTIYCSLQDRFGFMWIGTRDGLCRYDGHSFVRLEDLTSEITTSGLVLAADEDENGKIWFSSSMGIGYYNPANDEAESMGRIGNATCFDLLADKRGNVWFASDQLYRHDTANGGMQRYAVGDTRPTMLALDSFGTVWVLTQDGTLFTYDRLKDSFRRQLEGISIVEAADDGRILVATRDNRVYITDCISLQKKHVFTAENGQIVRCLKESSKGEFWIGTDSGLFIRRENEVYNGEAFHDDATPRSVSADFITCIDKDKSGNLWIGTYYTGLNIWKDRSEDMSIYFMNPSDNSVKGKIVRSITSDHLGNIWFCTEDGFLNMLDPINRKMKNYEIVKGLNMHGLVMDGDRLWICSFGNGVYLFDHKSQKILKRYSFSTDRATTGIRCADGSIYIGTTQGLYRYVGSEDRFVQVEEAGTSHIHCLHQDSSGILWTGTYGNGIFCLDKDGNSIMHIEDTDSEECLSSRFITSFHEDSRHRMWVTTEGGGLCYTDPGYHVGGKMVFHNITRKDGLPSNVTCAVAEDNDGTIWVSTTNGVAYLSGTTAEVIGLMNESNEITGYQYSYGAVYSDGKGIIYFGNTDGMIALTPAKMKSAGIIHPLSITSVKAMDSDNIIRQSDQGLASVTSSRFTVRQQDASYISISFTVPEYSARNIRYDYSLFKGRKPFFNGSTSDNSILVRLPSGKYHFKVKASSYGDNDAYTKEMDFHIKPHPLLSKVAKVMYSIVLIALVTALILMIELKRKRDKARNLSKIISMKEKELYNAKINYFTNITHEIRTPLTLIKLPLDKIIAKGAYTPESEKDLRTMQANADRLLSLTNQLLDMRKMEENEIKLSCVRENICEIVRKASRYFEQMALEQHISLITDIPERPIWVMCAKDSIITIVSNLLSNAVKYGKDRICVSVSESEDRQKIFIRVESNGSHIPENESEKIFNIFFQRPSEHVKGRISQGTGLGLPYARTLANMHNGRLYLDVNVSDMNSFVLELPVQQEKQVVLEERKTEEKPAGREARYDSSRYSIMIVEDSEEMRSYLASELSDSYNVSQAANGEDALAILKSEKIDIVISDIMMPVMDGCELCNRIKNDSDLSHIPVILLTAAIGVETRIETLEIGADGYIEKPFPIELLRSNISNLFKNREISYRQFITKPLTHYNSVTASKVDNEFMTKLHEFIMKNIAEQDLNIDNLTSQLGTSKSSLYRKLKANTGLSINEYIRVCRLKQAAELLSSQKYKINEVAFMTGFSSASYFATCFQKQFEITPSEFIRNLEQ